MFLEKPRERSANITFVNREVSVGLPLPPLQVGLNPGFEMRRQKSGAQYAPDFESLPSAS